MALRAGRKYFTLHYHTDIICNHLSAVIARSATTKQSSTGLSVANGGRPAWGLPAWGSIAAPAAFDTWVHAHDHCNSPENLLIAPAAEAPAFAFIDYGQSLLEKWRAGGYKTEFAAPLYDGGTKPDFCALSAAVAAIETIPDATIRIIVDRIPPEFLAPPHAQVTIEGLLYRRDHLRVILAGTYAALAG